MYQIHLINEEIEGEMFNEFSKATHKISSRVTMISQVSEHVMLYTDKKKNVAKETSNTDTLPVL